MSDKHLPVENFLSNSPSLSAATNTNQHSDLQLVLKELDDVKVLLAEQRKYFESHIAHLESTLANLVELQKSSKRICQSCKDAHNLVSSARLGSSHLECVKWFLDMNEDPNKLDINMHSALSWASRGGFTDIVDALLSGKADPNLADEKGRTALYWAAARAEPLLVMKLLDAGASLKLLDAEGSSPFHVAAAGHISSLGIMVDYERNAFLMRLGYSEEDCKDIGVFLRRPPQYQISSNNASSIIERNPILPEHARYHLS